MEDADIVVGLLDKAEADLPVSGASVFIFPSLCEGFGIQPLEAMSYDRPVVCSNTSSIPAVVGEAGEYNEAAC